MGYTVANPTLLFARPRTNEGVYGVIRCPLPFLSQSLPRARRSRPILNTPASIGAMSVRPSVRVRVQCNLVEGCIYFPSDT